VFPNLKRNVEQTRKSDITVCRGYFRWYRRQFARFGIPGSGGKLATHIRSPDKVRAYFYVLANTSDNGGSTSEISRVIGGPGIGDIRSRLVRLMNENTPEQAAIKKLMGHRLPIDNDRSARIEWLEIVEGTHRYHHPPSLYELRVVCGTEYHPRRESY
jgi:2-phospho-L-lactate transferase CofD